MKQTRILMDMPITVEIVNTTAGFPAFDTVFSYFTYIDNKFSVFKETSEISKINRGKIDKHSYSRDMQTVLSLCEQTKQETYGYFDIQRNNRLDPSGLVKGWAIYNAAKILRGMGFTDYYVDAGGDIQTSGNNANGTTWTVGIRNPFNRQEHIKAVRLKDKGIATSGTYIRGNHIYNPHDQNTVLTDIVSLTVIGPDVYQADRFATAAFAMGKKGIQFIESLPGFEGYMIDLEGNATYTVGFSDYVATH